MTPPSVPNFNKHFTHQQSCNCSQCSLDKGIFNDQNIKKAHSVKISERDDAPPSVPLEPVYMSSPVCQEPKSPIVSHNEVSSSAQDPPEPEHSRSRSPSPEEAPLPLVSEYKAPVFSWHHPTLTLAPARVPDSAPLMSSPGGPVVPLLLPACSYPSLSHSLVYMNPFMPPCQSAMADKKKRNRTFIDPVTEVGVT